MAGVITKSSQLRWGILGTGWISSMFTRDLLAHRPGAPVVHKIVAIGSSSVQKGNAFVDKAWQSADAQSRPQVYADYQGVYDNPDVDIVYIGTPHSVHKENCLAAIAAGKHILCEKPFTINAREAREVIDAARTKGVFVMEEIIEKRSIGDVQRVFVDFGNRIDLDALPSDSRLKDPALGAGALLDIGVYALTYASIIMGEWKVGNQHPQLKKVVSSLTISEGIDKSNVVVLEYPSTGNKSKHGSKTAICTSTFQFRGSEDFARIEGSNGSIVIFGISASLPGGFRITEGPQPGYGEADNRQTRTYQESKPEGTFGFIWEADAVAEDIANGRTENDIMPLDETLRMMELMDSIRRAGELVYPQDKD